MDIQTQLKEWISLLDDRLSSVELSLKALQKRLEASERKQEELEEIMDQLREEIDDCVADTTYLHDILEDVQDDLDEMKK